MRFRRRPVIVEAVQVRQGEGLPSEFVGEHYGLFRHTEEGTILIQTPDGTMEAQPGDWVIREDAGRFRPCKPDVFRRSYEVAGDDPFEGGVRSWGAWMIERAHLTGVEYLAISREGPHWTDQALAGLQFVRQQDARQVLAYIPHEGALVTEHEFVGIPVPGARE